MEKLNIYFIFILTYRCEICEKKYSSKHSLNSHKRLMHLPIELKPYRCDICSDTIRAYTTKTKLVQHMFIKHSSQNDKKFVCSECDNKYIMFTYVKI